MNGSPSQAATIDVRSPVTGELIGTTPITTREEVAAAVQRAREAQPVWQAMGVRERARLMNRWRNILYQDNKQAMQVIRRETGKNDASAFVELAVMDASIDYYVKEAPRVLRPQTRRPLFPLIQRARMYYKPLGVTGFIAPWNYPFFLAMIDMTAALIAGNTAVIKPSEVTPFSAIYAVELMRRAGIPRDVVQVVTGDGTTGAALVDMVDYISFTGSAANGKKVAQRATERLIPFSLELGGKDPVIVLNDANLDAAASGSLRGALENAGQMCVSVERVYVESGIYDAFVDRVISYAQTLKIGSGDGFDIHMGSMTHERELLRAEAHVEDALAKGATLLYGGKRRPDLGPLFFEPTILINVDHSMKVMCEETFGPILPIMQVRDAEEAIAYANDSDYGLSATIYTSNFKRGEQLALRLESGDVSINRPQIIFGTPSLPMGGEKQSGFGRRNGREGLLRFVKTQSIMIDSTLGTLPALTHADPVTLWGFRILRVIRRFLRFV